MRQHHLFLAPEITLFSKASTVVVVVVVVTLAALRLFCLAMYVPFGGEEKAGFGAQPRDSDAILPCPRDISNNIEVFGA